MTRKNALILVLGILVVLVIGMLVFRLLTSDENQSERYYSQLTGVEVERDRADRPILAVMIENSEAARPQTGLDAAGIVFEAVTESGITRYLALYQEDMPEVIGPVRSVRHNFVDWVMGFDASVAHVGGSAQALELLEQRDARSLNQFHYSEPYFRDNNRAAPHNMYVRSEDLRELQAELGHDSSEFTSVPRSDDQPATNPEAETVSVDFSSPVYRVEFRYDRTANAYTRYLAGEPHVDEATGQPVTVKNVIIVRTSNEDTGATGSGEALVFKNGNVHTGRWQKPSYKDRIQIVDEQDNQVPFNRGDSWFVIVPAGRQVTY